MRPLVFLWPYAALFWPVFVWAFLPELILVTRARHGAASRTSRDSGSLRLIVRGIWIALLAALPLSFVQAPQFPPAAATAAVWGGTILVIGGSLLRRLCWRTLGRYFTGDVQAQSDQPVIERGPYRWVRHPSYTGGILMFAGVGVAFCNWLSVAVLVLTSIGVYSYRIHVEERALLEALGAPYATYMKRTTRYIPFII